MPSDKEPVISAQKMHTKQVNEKDIWNEEKVLGKGSGHRALVSAKEMAVCPISLLASSSKSWTQGRCSVASLWL